MTVFSMALTTFADAVRVHIKVVANESNEPIMDANIRDVKTDILYHTNDNGDCYIDVIEGTTTHLKIFCVGRNVEDIKLNGKQSEIEVRMKYDLDMHQLGEVTVKASRKQRIPLKPREIPAQWRGDTLYTTYELPIETTYLKDDRRIVAQPFFYDENTQKTYLTEPIALDAIEYHTTQIRDYNFAVDDHFTANIGPHKRTENPIYDPLYENIITEDTILHRSVVADRRTRTLNLSVPMRIVVRDPETKNHDWYYGANTYIETYTRVVKEMENDTIGAGIKDPLRLLDYKLGGRLLSDSTWFPRPQAKPMQTKDKLNLRFAVGKTTIDRTDSVNNAELSKMDATVRSISTGIGTTVDKVTVVGTASPDGLYQANLKLANQRMDALMQVVTANIPSDRRTYMHKETKARVASWEEVAALLREDSLNDEARQIEDICARTGNMDAQGKQIRGLSFYSMLLKDYLPRLRTVEYQMEYQIRRELTAEEIYRFYKENPRQLADWEFFKMYRAVTDSAEQLKMCETAREMFPDLLLFNNDLCALRIGTGKADTRLLRPYVGEKYRHRKVPDEVNGNQIVAQLMANNLTGADTLEQILPVTEENELIHALVQVKFQQFTPANYRIIAKTGVRNEIVYLLAEDTEESNAKALELCEKLDDKDPISYVLRSMCISRDESDPQREAKASGQLKVALDMDPSLEKKVGNQFDLMKSLKIIRKNRVTPQTSTTL